MKIAELLNLWDELEDILLMDNKEGDLECYEDFYNSKKGTSQQQE
jgi:hypothetical protein